MCSHIICHQSQPILHTFWLKNTSNVFWKKGIIGGGEGVALGASAPPVAAAAADAPMAAMSPRCRQITENPEIGIWKMDLFFFEKIDLIAYTTFLETLKFNEV